MYSKNRRNLLVALLVGLLLVGAIALPSLAQDATPTATPDPSTLMWLVGPLDLTSGQIVVNGYVIVPMGGLPPVTLQQGDIVIITGYLQPDGVTIHAITFDVFDEDPDVTLTPTVIPPTLTPTLEATLEVTPEATPEVTPEVTPTLVACDFPNQPVAMQIAESFNVTYEEVIAQHCAGFGFGEITRAYLLAETTGETAQYYLDLAASGLGWGQIVNDTGVHPSELAPGQVHRGGYNPEATPDPEATEEADVQGASRGNDNCPGNSCNAPGQNNGGGNGNSGNNGNGGGNGNENSGGNGNGGNGSGRGNGGGNGNSGGNGNGNNGNGRGNGG